MYNFYFNLHCTLDLCSPQPHLFQAPGKKVSRLPPLSFVRTYVGAMTMSIIGEQTLSTAFIDYNVNDNGKPSYIIRLAAKNHNGYGAAVQVRWLRGMHLIALPVPIQTERTFCAHYYSHYDHITWFIGLRNSLNHCLC